MIYTESPPLPSTRWEPCIAFQREDDEELICAECGWLREEHPAPDR